MRSARVSPTNQGQNPVTNGVKAHENVQKIAVLPETNQTEKEEEVRNGNKSYPKSILRKETRYPSPARPATGFVDFLQRIFNPEFDSPALERTYRRYFSGQKNASLVFLVIAAVLINFCLIIIYAAYFGNDEKLQTRRIIVAVLFLILNGIVLLFFVCCRRRSPTPILPRLIWITLLTQLILNLCLNYSSLHPTDSVCLYVFFIYLTYTLLPFRLYSCLVLCLTAAITHVGITGAFSNKNREDLTKLVCIVYLFVHFSQLSIFPPLLKLFYN